MQKILDDVRRDAITKLQTSTKNSSLLTDVAIDIFMISHATRIEGLLYLEELVENHESAFAKWLAMLIVDGTDPDLLCEMATNEYWTRASEDIYAMVDYLYIRGMLCVQEGLHDELLANFLQTLIPSDFRSEYQTKLHAKRTAMEGKNRKENLKKFACICPVFQDEKTLEKIHGLENRICKFSDRTMQRVVRDLENDCVEICVYAMGKKARKKVLDNMSLRLSGQVIEDIVHFVSIQEREVLKQIEKAQDVINRLLDMGEIYEPDEK